MGTRNGYIITYYKGVQFIDTETTLSMEDAEEMVNVAIHVDECDMIIFHCMDRGEVMYTNEFFNVDGTWVHTRNCPQMKDTFTMTVL